MLTLNNTQADVESRSHETVAQLERTLERQSKISIDFVVLLCISTVIATLGLFENSPAVVIGAMIIAPLMRPLAGLSLAILTRDWLLLRRASLTLLVGTFLAISIAFVVALMLHEIVPTTEMLARTKPTLLDLGIAFFAGAIGGYSQLRAEKESVAGVAVAVALVPPLAVIGIGLAYGLEPLWRGAFLLYLTNLSGISLAGSLVFLAARCSSLRRARGGLLTSFVLLAALAAPLAVGLNDVLLENRLSRRISALLKERTFTFRDLTLRHVNIDSTTKAGLMITATVAGDQSSITPRQVGLVQGFLMRELGQPLKLRIKLAPISELTANGPS